MRGLTVQIRVGTLDHASCVALRQLLRACTGAPTHLVVDLRRMDHFHDGTLFALAVEKVHASGSALGAFIAVASTARLMELLVTAGMTVRRELPDVPLSHLLTIVDVGERIDEPGAVRPANGLCLQR
jgi:anti-anti-sigma regulatory factor